MGYWFRKMRVLYDDMHLNHYYMEEFSFTFNGVMFSCIYDIGKTPHRLLVGAIRYSWACIIKVYNGFNATMSDNDFYCLCDILNLTPGKGSLTSFSFLQYIDNHFPQKCSCKLISPTKLFRFYPPRHSNGDPDERTVFVGWNTHKTDGRTARNFDKTEQYFGKEVADFCRTNNISSIWTTPEDGKESLSFPPGYH